jgi:hypothetical protein
VDVVATQENLPGENRDDLPVRAEGTEQRDRLLLPGIAEDGQDQAAVGEADVETPAFACGFTCGHFVVPLFGEGAPGLLAQLFRVLRSPQLGLPFGGWRDSREAATLCK